MAGSLIPPEFDLRLALTRNHRLSLTGWHFDGAVYSGEDSMETIPREENIFAIQDKAFIDALASGNASGIHSPYADSLKTLAATLKSLSWKRYTRAP